MNPSIFSRAINEAFPQIDESVRTEIYNKVSTHTIEVLKDHVYKGDSNGLQSLDQIIQEEKDDKKRSEVYLKQILEKFAALSLDEQKSIESELDTELTHVMHEVYKAYE